MKRNSTKAVLFLTAGMMFAASALAQQAPAANAPAASPSSTMSEKDKASYAIGISIGRTLQRDGIDVDPAMVTRGMQDTLSGGKVLLTDDEARAAITRLQQDAHTKQEAQMKAAGDANKKEGEAFLATNKTKPGVKALPDGLQYKVEKEGTGPKPTANDTVECHYRGTLINGTEFDSSYKRGQPATFPVNGVIKGWTEILQQMPVGSKYQVFIPSELAYGERGAGADIGPNATLIFEIELLSIKAK